MTGPVRIEVVVNPAEVYARGVLRGVASFAFGRAWECHVPSVSTTVFQRPGPISGRIVQASTPESLLRIRESSVPVVNISSAMIHLPEMANVPSMICDDEAAGRQGAEHFLRRGFRRFIFYAPLDRQYTRLRHAGFQTRLTEDGCSAELIDHPVALAAALVESPTPLAVMACNDASALTALDLCRSEGIRVPDEVAVLGVDNDDVANSLALPPLSSVNTAPDRIGFEAAALLERLIAGEKPEPLHRRIAPAGIVTRQSTDLLAVNDPDVAASLRFIRTHAGSLITVEDVLAVVTISRRQLERRFRSSLGRSVLDEIRRCRIDRARQLLAETALPIPQVATASGFATASYLTVVFKEETGTTPAAFREAHRSMGVPPMIHGRDARATV